MDFDFSLFIGRFQPLHKGHVQLMNEAAKISKKVMIGIGSWDSKNLPSLRNPFDGMSRDEMLRWNLRIPYKSIFLRDFKLPQKKILNKEEVVVSGNELWKNNVQYMLHKHANLESPSETSMETSIPKIAIVGHKHDDTSFYLDMFPEYQLINFDNIDEIPHATEIRQMIYDEGFHGPWNKHTHLYEKASWEKFLPEHVPTVVRTLDIPRLFYSSMYGKETTHTYPIPQKEIFEYVLVVYKTLDEENTKHECLMLDFNMGHHLHSNTRHYLPRIECTQQDQWYAPTLPLIESCLTETCLLSNTSVGKWLDAGAKIRHDFVFSRGTSRGKVSSRILAIEINDPQFKLEDTKNQFRRFYVPMNTIRYQAQLHFEEDDADMVEHVSSFLAPLHYALPCCL